MPLTGSRRRWVIAAAALVALVIVALVTARALSNSGTGAEPASVTPTEAGVFLSVDLEPGGQQGSDAKAVLGRLLGNPDDPDRALSQTLDPLLGALGGGGAPLRWQEDVRPWLGRHVGFFAVTLGGPRPSYALLLQAADEGQARRALGRLAGGGSPAAARTRQGVRYAARPDGLAWAVAKDFAVIGTERGVQAAIDASKRFALGESDRYTQAIAQRDVPLAFLYVDLKHFVDTVPPVLLGGSRAARELRLRLARVEDSPYVVSVSAPDDRDLAVDFGRPPTPKDPGEPPTQVGGGLDGTALLPTRLLPRMPADAWLAADFPEFGQRLYDAFNPTVNPGLPSGALRELQVRTARRTGIDVARDVIPWVGTVGAFLRGERAGGLNGIGGAVVAESLDPAASRRAVTKLARYLRRSGAGDVASLRRPGTGAPGFVLRLRGVPAPVVVYARGNRVVAGIGATALVDALDAPRKLGAVPGYRRATERLGGTLVPAAWMSPSRAIAAAAALGLDRSQWFRLARPYLARIAYGMYGTKRLRRRILVGVR